MAAYNALSLIFCKFYSINFDNYKIIEKILSQNKKYILLKEIEKNKEIDFIDSSNKESLIELNNNSNNIHENFSSNNIINDYDIETDHNNDKSENKKNENNNRILPKLHFYDFFFNNIYCKKCCSSNKQNLISICNEIISKYYSIDSILINQIKLENLFKDYQWKNQKLNNIENNYLINQLKLDY